jgi:leucyl aminopeptidase (aminopeptidase T)
MIKIMHPRAGHGVEPPRTVAKAMAEADVVFCPTEKSLTHTDARREACEKFGSRIATLPMITEEIFIRGLLADYQDIKKRSERLLALVNDAKIAKVTTPSGTDLTIDLSNEFEADVGIIPEKGMYSNLPAGEVCGAPKEGTTEGVLVINQMGEIITEPTRIEITRGTAVKIEQNQSGARLQKLLDEAVTRDKNRNAFNIAELGIGTNPSAQLSGCVLEDEKVLGTVHIALGDNTSYAGGKTAASIHEDGIILKPTVTLDGKGIMKDGKMLL